MKIRRVFTEFIMRSPIHGAPGLAETRVPPEAKEKESRVTGQTSLGAGHDL